LQHRENWDGDGYSTVNGIVKRNCQLTNVIGMKSNNGYYHSKGACKYGSECA